VQVVIHGDGIALKVDADADLAVLVSAAALKRTDRTIAAATRLRGFLRVRIVNPPSC
jgi:hypothetical protein